MCADAKNTPTGAQQSVPSQSERRAPPVKFTYSRLQVSGTILNRMAGTNVSMAAEPEAAARQAQIMLNIPEGVCRLILICVYQVVYQVE